MSSSKADNRRNVILTHTVESDDWEFRRGISKYSTLDFEVESMSTGNGDSKLRNIICYFLFPFIVFLKRNHYNFIVANQQFYGLLLAFYCRLFHVRKSFKMVVIAYIYKPKNGWIGWIYQKFMQYIATSDYIDKYVVRSSRELETYPQLLGIDPSRLVFIPLGLGGNFDAPIDEAMQQRKYVLSVGRSNRNYPFLIDALEDVKDYNVEIICDTLNLEPRNPRIRVHKDIHAELPLWMKNCYCVVIPLLDKETSSGQLVLLQAMMEGKPVIITRSNAIMDYFIPSEIGFAIENTKEELLQALKTLYTDTELYQQFSLREKELFQERFSAERDIEAIGKLIKSLIE